MVDRRRRRPWSNPVLRRIMTIGHGWTPWQLIAGESTAGRYSSHSDRERALSTPFGRLTSAKTFSDVLAASSQPLRASSSAAHRRSATPDCPANRATCQRAACHRAAGPARPTTHLNACSWRRQHQALGRDGIARRRPECPGGTLAFNMSVVRRSTALEEGGGFSPLIGGNHSCR
jgi:hypothetical protein